VQDDVAEPVLAGGVDDRAQQREAAPLAVDGVLARRERDVAAVARATFLNAEPDQLESVQDALGEVQFGIRELAGRIAAIVGDEDDLHVMLL
jgi:hypothetical protein